MKTKTSIILLLSLFPLLAGCLGGPPDQQVGGQDDDQATGVRSALSLPIRFHGAASGEAVFMEKHLLKDCRWDPRPIATYRLFDRNGLVTDAVVEIDLASDDEIIPVPISGAPPWLLAGHQNPCMSVASSLEGALGAEIMEPEIGFSYNEAEQWENVTLTVQEGQTEATQVYVPNSTVARVQAAWFDFKAGRALFNGNIFIDYGDGEPWAVHRFSATGASTADFQPIQFHPKGYVIRIESNLPVTSDVIVRFTFQAMDLHGLMCDHGFHWDECGHK